MLDGGSEGEHEGEEIVGVGEGEGEADVGESVPRAAGERWLGEDDACG